MKKSLLFGFAAALTLASCTTNDEVLDTAVQTPMEFSSFVNKSTKVGGPLTTINVVDSTFGVWGYKTKTADVGGTDEIKIFDTQNSDAGDLFKTITCAAAPAEGKSAVWTYSPIRYWDKTSTYRFYAFAPARYIKATISEDKNITISNFNVNPTIAEQCDLLIADPITKDPADRISTVDFTFRHILTKVNVRFQTTIPPGQPVVLKSATLHAKLGTSTYTQGATPAWSEPTKTTSLSSTSLGTNGITLLGQVTSNNVFDGLLMIPQAETAKTLNLDVTYTLDGEVNTRSINLTGVAWQPNHNVTYVVTIGASAIEFGTQVVEGWDSVTQTPGTGSIN